MPDLLVASITPPDYCLRLPSSYTGQYMLLARLFRIFAFIHAAFMGFSFSRQAAIRRLRDTGAGDYSVMILSSLRPSFCHYRISVAFSSSAAICFRVFMIAPSPLPGEGGTMGLPFSLRLH